MSQKELALEGALSKFFRSRRDALLRDVISSTPRRGAILELVDIGGRAEYWHRVGLDFLKTQRVRITLVNLTQSELGESDDPTIFAKAIGDARALDFPDFAFDLAHANSVIEHVGLWHDTEAFAREMQRVAPAFYCQTPNFWFPIEPHFPLVPCNHWLPRPIRANLMQLLPLGYGGRRAQDVAHASAMLDSARLLTRAQLRSLFPNARIHAERLVLAKSYIAVQTAPPIYSS